MDLIDSYPLDTSGGGCFLTAGMAQRDMRDVDDQGRAVRRLERVIVTPKTFIYEDPPPQPGRVCIGEMTAIHMGKLVGLHDRHEYAAVVRESKALRKENDELSGRVAALERDLEAAREDHNYVRVIYVAPDRTEHGSKQALDRYLDRQEAPA